MSQHKDKYYKSLALNYVNSAKLNRCVAAVHVEALDDELFWKKVLGHYLPKYSFHFITHTKTKEGNNATGCTTCLKYWELGCLSKNFIICIDSDYRYLQQEKNMNIRNFIFQTYTYSIENHWCFSNGINRIFNKSGLENNLFDFNQFLKYYSNILYELFLYHLHSLSLGDDIFEKKEFCQLLNLNSHSTDCSKMIQTLEESVSPKLLELKNYYSKINIQTLSEKYYTLGLNKDNGYLYFRGHNVFEQVVLAIAKNVKEKLQKSQQTHNLAGKQKYIFYNSTIHKDFKSYFSQDLCYDEYAEFLKISDDARKYVQILKK